MKFRLSFILVAALASTAAFLSFGCATARPPELSSLPRFDVLIINGTVYDGSDGQPFRADIGIKGDRIVAIGDLQNSSAVEIIDADGLYVMPGIIDVHNHADRELLEIPDAPNLIQQGITTLVTGNCGGAEYPVGDFFDRLEEQGIALNVAHLIGHNTIRREVMGMEARAPTQGELKRMKQKVREGMEEGAIGLSTGLKYTPGAWAETDEVVELAKVVSEFGGVYTSHMREEGRGLVDAMRETIDIGRKAGLPVQISHHKVVCRDIWGASETTLALVDEALKEGIVVHIDQYPYAATSTGLTVLFPPWSLEGGQEELEARLADPAIRLRIRGAIVDNIVHDRGGADPANILIASCRSRPEAEGKNISQLLDETGRPNTMEEAAELIMEIQAEGGAQAIYFCLSDDDIERIMRHPVTMIGSDSAICTPGEGVPHPRNYGAFPRVFRRYVRELKVLTVQEAIEKMTSLPAKAFKLKGRGLIQRGAFADICVFDPELIADTATWSEPHQYPDGIKAVIVNGTIEVLDGAQLERRAGKVLRHYRNDGAPE